MSYSMILLLSTLISFTTSDYIFQKTTRVSVKNELLSSLSNMQSLYTFDDITYEDVTYNYNKDFFITLTSLHQSQVKFNQAGLDVSFTNNSLNLIQVLSNSPYLSFEFTFKLALSTSTSDIITGSFLLETSGFELHKIINSTNETVHAETHLSFVFSNLIWNTDKCTKQVDAEFIQMMIRFFAYSQETIYGENFNNKAADIYYSTHPENIKISLIVNSVPPKENVIEFTETKPPLQLSDNTVQKTRSGIVNGRKLDTEGNNPSFDSTDENIFYIHKNVFYNLINDNWFSFSVNDSNKLNSDYKWNTNYLFLLSNDFDGIPQSMGMIMDNKIISYTPIYKGCLWMWCGNWVIDSDFVSGETSLLKIQTNFNVNFNWQYTDKVFNLPYTSFNINSITVMSDCVRINDISLLNKWISDSYRKYFEEHLNWKLWEVGINFITNKIFDFSANVSSDEYWIIFKDNEISK